MGIMPRQSVTYCAFISHLQCSSFCRELGTVRRLTHAAAWGCSQARRRSVVGGRGHVLVSGSPARRASWPLIGRRERFEPAGGIGAPMENSLRSAVSCMTAVSVSDMAHTRRESRRRGSRQSRSRRRACRPRAARSSAARWNRARQAWRPQRQWRPRRRRARGCARTRPALQPARQLLARALPARAKATGCARRETRPTRPRLVDGSSGGATATARSGAAGRAAAARLRAVAAAEGTETSILMRQRLQRRGDADAGPMPRGPQPSARRCSLSSSSSSSSPKRRGGAEHGRHGSGEVEAHLTPDAGGSAPKMLATRLIGLEEVVVIVAQESDATHQYRLRARHHPRGRRARDVERVRRRPLASGAGVSPPTPASTPPSSVLMGGRDSGGTEPRQWHPQHRSTAPPRRRSRSRQSRQTADGAGCHRIR